MLVLSFIHVDKLYVIYDSKPDIYWLCHLKWVHKSFGNYFSPNWIKFIVKQSNWFASFTTPQNNFFD